MPAIDFITPAISFIVSSGLIGLIYKNLETKIDQKQDKIVCDIAHKEIDKDLARGQQNFDKIIVTISDLKDQLAINNRELALHNQSLVAIKHIVETSLAARRKDD